MDLMKLAQKIMEKVTTGGIRCEVYGQSWTDSSIRVKDGRAQHLGVSNGQGIGIRLLKTGKISFFETNQVEIEKIDRSLKQAIDLIDILPQTSLRDFAQSQAWQPISDLLDPDFSIASTMDREKEFLEFERSVRQQSPDLESVSSRFYQRRSRIFLVNSNGAGGGFEKTNFNVETGFLLIRREDRLDWDEDSDAAIRKNLQPIQSLADSILPMLIGSIGGRPVPTGLRPVVFHPSAGSRLIGAILDCLKGDAVNRKDTFLADELNHKIGSSLLVLTDDPRRPGSAFARPFDGEGVPTISKIMIENGVLKNFFDDLTTSAESGRSPGNAIRDSSGLPEIGWHEIVMKPGELAPEDIYRGSENGILITRLMGFGLDPVSGNYSVGAMGRLIENGKPGRPVAGITIADNLRDILANIDMVGRDLVLSHSINCPTFRVSKMMIGGS
jgi:PmbA protein